MAAELNVVGLMNVQYAVKDNRLYVLEVNPRASRTVPFVSKATGVPLAKLATKVMLGRQLENLGLTGKVVPAHISVKEAVLPFDRFPGVDTLLGPEMKSTGEVMGIDTEFGAGLCQGPTRRRTETAVQRNRIYQRHGPGQEGGAAGGRPVSVVWGSKSSPPRGTQRFLDLKRPFRTEMIKKFPWDAPMWWMPSKTAKSSLSSTPAWAMRRGQDGYLIRRAAIKYNIPYATTIAGAVAMCRGITALKEKKLTVKPFRSINESEHIIER